MLVWKFLGAWLRDQWQKALVLVKNKNKLDSELVNKALRQYFFSVNKNPIKLFNYAKKLKVYKKLKIKINTIIIS